MINIALYSGSFSPIHFGHIFTVSYLSSLGKFDNVLVAPVCKHPDGKNLIEYHHRYEMCRLGMGWIHNTTISDVEKQVLDLPDYPDVNYTYFTVKRIKEIHPDWNIHLVVGADISNNLKNWTYGEELLKISTPFIVGRQGYKHQDPSIMSVLPDISSTKVRESFINDPDHIVAKTFLPEVVYSYIIDNKLYEKF